MHILLWLRITHTVRSIIDVSFDARSIRNRRVATAIDSELNLPENDLFEIRPVKRISSDAYAPEGQIPRPRDAGSLMHSVGSSRGLDTKTGDFCTRKGSFQVLART